MKPNNKMTGERLETSVFNLTTIEHLHRYAVALDLVTGKKVLDIACGEGYGSNLMAENAEQVTGIDLDRAVIEKAKKKYTRSNLLFCQGSTSHIPGADNCFDRAISFETLEHVEEQEQFFTEIKRVLKPGGLLLISTPDKHQYSELANYNNPFHKKELYEKEFKALVDKYFQHASYYKQSSFTGSLIVKENNPEISHTYSGNYATVTKEISPPYLYHIAVASDFPFQEISSSLFQDPQLLSRLLEEQQMGLKKTLTYRTGHRILSPLKLIRSLFRK